VRLILLASEERYDLELRIGVVGAEGGTEKTSVAALNALTVDMRTILTPARDDCCGLRTNC